MLENLERNRPERYGTDELEEFCEEIGGEMREVEWDNPNQTPMACVVEMPTMNTRFRPHDLGIVAEVVEPGADIHSAEVTVPLGDEINAHGMGDSVQVQGFVDGEYHTEITVHPSE